MRATPWTVQLIAVTLWLGAAILFAAAVAPALFAVLPARALAGAVVSRVLPVIFYSGMIIALLSLGLSVGAGRGWHWLGAESASVVMFAACAIAQFVVTPRMEKLRADMGGALDALPSDDARRVAFGHLHVVSVAWMGLAMICAAVIAVVAARSLLRLAPARDVPGISDR